MFQKVANIMSFSNKSKKNDIFIDAANIISLCNKRKETNILTIKAEKMNVRPISFMPKKKNLDIRIFNELRTQILHSEPSFLRDEESFRREDPWMTTFSERRSLNLRRRERYSAMFPTPSSTFISNLCRSEREVAPSIRYFLLWFRSLVFVFRLRLFLKGRTRKRQTKNEVERFSSQRERESVCVCVKFVRQKWR